MVVVALAAVFVCGLMTAMRMSRRARNFQLRAAQLRAEADAAQAHLTLCRMELAALVRAADRLRTRAHNIDHPKKVERQIAEQARWWRANQAHAESMVTYLATMAQKYAHAARYPWLAVGPDPAMPFWSGAAVADTDRPEFP
jgi:hypothetical protein